MEHTFCNERRLGCLTSCICHNTSSVHVSQNAGVCGGEVIKCIFCFVAVRWQILAAHGMQNYASWIERHYYVALCLVRGAPSRKSTVSVIPAVAQCLSQMPGKCTKCRVLATASKPRNTCNGKLHFCVLLSYLPCLQSRGWPNLSAHCAQVEKLLSQPKPTSTCGCNAVLLPARIVPPIELRQASPRQPKAESTKHGSCSGTTRSLNAPIVIVGGVDLILSEVR